MFGSSFMIFLRHNLKGTWTDYLNDSSSLGDEIQSSSSCKICRGRFTAKFNGLWRLFTYGMDRWFFQSWWIDRDMYSTVYFTKH